jgi:polyhydroxybutyrate depolymerase
VIIFLFILFCKTHIASAQNELPRSPGTNASLNQQIWIENSLKVSDLPRWFRIHQPANYTQGSPVVVLLHGGTQSMRKVFGPKAGATKEWLTISDKYGFLLVVPNGVNIKTGDTYGDNQTWNDGRAGLASSRFAYDDVAFIRTLLDYVNHTYHSDMSRIFVTGASNGGHMTNRLILESPELFAAAAPFIANTQTWIPFTRKPALPTPLLIGLGTEDQLNKFQGGSGLGRVKNLSAYETEAFWVKINHARRIPQKSVLADLDPEDGCRIVLNQHDALPDGAPVHFYVMRGMGHQLPSVKHRIPDTFLIRQIFGNGCHDAETAEIAWHFFQTFGIRRRQ